MFGIIILVSLFAMIFALMFHHYRRVLTTAKINSADFKITDYFSWYVNRISKQISVLFKNSFKKSCQKLLKKVIIFRYPEVEKWSIVGLSLSFLFLATSGFIYALFFTRSLHGYALLFHVILGGVFSVSLSIVVVLWAPVYSFGTEKEKFSNDSPDRRETPRPVTVKQKILFWLFVISGFLLILTALTLMLPVFSLKDHLSMVDIHRYSALVALLSAIAFVYFTLAENRK